MRVTVIFLPMATDSVTSKETSEMANTSEEKKVERNRTLRNIRVIMMKYV
jgi:hypothetical protein